MKKAFLLFLFLMVCLFPSFSQADISNLGFSYSALVRDSIGRVQPSKAVKLRFTLLQGQTGTTTNSPWIETQSTTTDAYGFVNVTIGNGVKEGGSAATFSAVDFASANFWILIEVYNISSAAYDPLAKQGLQAVPYAKVAGAVTGSGGIPPGTIVAFGGDEAHMPNGWLLCDGHEVDNNDPKYQALFNAIQYSWGTTNHTNKFNIPYTMGMFLRGVSDKWGNDPDTASRLPVNVGGSGGNNVGSFQSDGFASHDHLQFVGEDRVGPSILPPYTPNTSPLYSSKLSGSDYWNYHIVPSQTSGKRADMLPGSLTGGSETRPKNVYVNYIIKL